MDGGSCGELPVSPAFVTPGPYLKFLLKGPFKNVRKGRIYGAGSRIYILAMINIVRDEENFSYQSWIIHVLEVSAPWTSSLAETMNAPNS